jgi:hypothetical protein
MLVKIAVPLLTLMGMSNFSTLISMSEPRGVGDIDALVKSGNYVSEHTTRLAQNAPSWTTPIAPPPTKPNTNKNPGGAAQGLKSTLTEQASAQVFMIKGVITRVLGDKVEIAEQPTKPAVEGPKYRFTLSRDATITVADVGTLADIKAGVGVSAGPDVLQVYPREFMASLMKQPLTTDLVAVVSAVDRDKITIGGPDVTYEIPFHPTTKIVRYEFGTVSDLMPGVSVYVAVGELAPDGSTVVSNIAVGRHGVKPNRILSRP